MSIEAALLVLSKRPSLNCLIHAYLVAQLCVFRHVALAVGPLLGLGIGSWVLGRPRPCCVPLSSSEGASGVLFQQILIEVSSVLLDKFIDFFCRSADVNLLVFLDVTPDNLFDRFGWRFSSDHGGDGEDFFFFVLTVSEALKRKILLSLLFKFSVVGAFLLDSLLLMLFSLLLSALLSFLLFVLFLPG